MYKLYGFASSNYFNMVKLALLEKRLPFEVMPLHGCQNPETLAISARGKVPVLGTPNGFISETDVILRYIEDTHPQPALLPIDPFERAQIWTTVKEIELYIELPARLCYVEVLFAGRATPEALKAKARRDLIKGFAALARRARIAPYLSGNEFTLADIYFMYSVDLAQQVAQQLFGLNLIDEVMGARQLLAQLNDRPNARIIAADREVDYPLFLERVRPAGAA
ncbi:glutathione S-transferase family protein [Pseudomonas sp. NPDC090203]|uniref:glutathione S-transferase family protein n=1 Tax=Pseudomonas sp. NPDC090203 TaxID=3364477 RepID=UPI0037FF31AE